MAIHKTFGKGRNVLKPNDKIYTLELLAKKIIKMFPLSGKVLDPFKGGGAFYNNLPTHTENDWCEIDDGKDFFKWETNVDWIISNPPYSIYDEIMTKSMEIAENIVYLIPYSKVVSSLKRLKQISKYGGIVSIYYLGASKCGFPFGFPAVIIHLKKDYKGQTLIKEFVEE